MRLLKMAGMLMLMAGAVSPRNFKEIAKCAEEVLSAYASAKKENRG